MRLVHPIVPCIMCLYIHVIAIYQGNVQSSKQYSTSSIVLLLLLLSLCLFVAHLSPNGENKNKIPQRPMNHFVLLLSTCSIFTCTTKSSQSTSSPYYTAHHHLDCLLIVSRRSTRGLVKASVLRKPTYNLPNLAMSLL